MSESLSAADTSGLGRSHVLLPRKSRGIQPRSRSVRKQHRSTILVLRCVFENTRNKGISHLLLGRDKELLALLLLLLRLDLGLHSTLDASQRPHLFLVAARSAFCFSLRKYSPLSICRSTLLGVMWFSGGKGVYLRVTRRRRLHFFSFTTVFFFAGLFSFLNLGRKRSQFSFFMLGSYL